MAPLIQEFPTLNQLLDLADDVSAPDIAVANLLCASDLRGADPLAIDRYLEWLDEAAEKVRQETERNYHKFLDAPGGFENSQARFCMICLITVLQRQLGVGYNPKWKGLTPDSPTPEAFGVDASDLFIHAIIDGIGGTCGSLPVLYVAVGRRLGYPLFLVKAARHLFVRWDDPRGEHWHHPDRFNIEATGPGVHFLSDDFYCTWPRIISDEDIAVGIFLRSLTPREELAEFIATRGYCLQANRRFDEAIAAFAAAAQLSPRNRHFVTARESLRMHLAMRKRGHAFLNAPFAGSSQEAAGPFWMSDPMGNKTLVQIVSPVRQAYQTRPSNCDGLHQHYLRSPHGAHVEVWLPLQSASEPMTAHWIDLHDGREALIHVPVHRQGLFPIRTNFAQQQQGIGQPVVPEECPRIEPAWTTIEMQREQARIPTHEISQIAHRIHETVRLMEEKSQTLGLPQIDPLALSAAPNIPRLPSSIPGIHLIH